MLYQHFRSRASGNPPFLRVRYNMCTPKHAHEHPKSTHDNKSGRHAHGNSIIYFPVIYNTLRHAFTFAPVQSGCSRHPLACSRRRPSAALWTDSRRQPKHARTRRKERKGRNNGQSEHRPCRSNWPKRKKMKSAKGRSYVLPMWETHMHIFDRRGGNS